MTPATLRSRVLTMRALTVPLRVIAAVLRCDEAEVVRVLEQPDKPLPAPQPKQPALIAMDEAAQEGRCMVGCGTDSPCIGTAAWREGNWQVCEMHHRAGSREVPIVAVQREEDAEAWTTHLTSDASSGKMTHHAIR